MRADIDFAECPTRWIAVDRAGEIGVFRGREAAHVPKAWVDDEEICFLYYSPLDLLVANGFVARAAGSLPSELEACTDPFGSREHHVVVLTDLAAYGSPLHEDPQVFILSPRDPAVIVAPTQSKHVSKKGLLGCPGYLGSWKLPFADDQALIDFGAWVYGASPDPYRRQRAPRTPVVVSELTPVLRDLAARIQLRDVRFAEMPELVPSRYLDCYTVGPEH